MQFQWQFLTTLVLFAACCTSAVAVSAIPAKQTAFQQQLVATVDKQAAIASKAATPALLQLLSAPSFRSHLGDCCSSVANLTSEQLLDRLVAEVRSAELTHNFNANSSGTWEGDMDIEAVIKTPYFPNLWTIMYLNLSAFKSQKEEDLAEVNLMGFPPFKTGGLLVSRCLLFAMYKLTVTA
jgi:hypothetical protein